MKPLFIWAGGKNKMLSHYKNVMPSSVKNYSEPFFGGGAMFIHVMKTYSPSNVVMNDINEDLIRIYSSIRNHYNEFITYLNDFESLYIPLSKPDRKLFYYDIRNQHAWSYQEWNEVEEAATLYFLMKTSFNGIYQVNKNTNNRYGTPSGLLNQKSAIYDRNTLLWWNVVLQKVTIQSGDWQDAILENAFSFFDPPYRSSFADYGNRFSDDQLLQLIQYSQSQKQVFLCNRDSNDGWFESHRGNLQMLKFPVTYTAGRRKRIANGHEAKKATEILLYKTE